MFIPKWFHLPLYVIAFFAAFWLLMLFAAWASGWMKLAHHFPASSRPTDAEIWRFNRVMFGVTACDGVCIGVSESGLFLETLPIFRIGHARILIPWSELEPLRNEKMLGGPLVYRTSVNVGPRKRIRITLFNQDIAEAARSAAQDVSSQAFVDEL
jgi:hypothetical protein